MLEKERIGMDRREFLRTSVCLGAGLSVPFFWGQNALGGQGAGRRDRILVLLELRGGNDGLNTVVPFGDERYYAARPGLAVEKGKVLKINDALGLHENLEGLMRLYDAGKVAVVNGAGYPNPNRSHFRSMEIWQSGSDADRYEQNGWIGKLNDLHPDANPDPLCGIGIAPQLNGAFWSERGLGVAFERAQQFRWRAGQQGDTQAWFARLNKVHEPVKASGDTLDYVRQVTQSIVKSSTRVIKAARVGAGKAEYPQNPLARNLKTVGQLIAGGLPTQVYHVAYGGFDTHANQAGQHQNLLQNFGASVSAFMRDMESRRLADRVLILCFSEFGRRVAQNASGGTDHGTAGPMFLIGSGVRPGLHGRYPDLGALDKNGDLQFTVDFRAVYAEVLAKWFGADAERVLGRKFSPIDLLAARA